MSDDIYVRLYRDVTGTKLLAQVPYVYRNVVKQAGARWSKTISSWFWRMDEFEDAVIHLKERGVRVTGPEDLAARIKNRELETADADAIRSGLVSSQHKVTDTYDDIPTYLYSHQKLAIRLAERFRQYAFFMDTGTGKTAVGIEIIRRLRAGGRALVVAPLSILQSAWGADLEKWGRGLTWALANKNRKTKIEALASDADVVIINYESFKILQKEIKAAGPWEIMILDESSKIKNPNTQVSRAMRLFASQVPRRYLLSATPAPNHPLEYWPQMNVVDPNLLGSAYTAFRTRYFYCHGFQGYEWSILPEKHNELMGRIRSRAQFVDKEDCLDLPRKMFVNRIVPMYAQQRTAYNHMRDFCRAQIEGGLVSASNTLSMIMKLRQITSGFVFDDQGNPKKVDSRKYDALDEVLSEIAGRSVIVWTNFHAEINALLAKYGAKARAIYGKVPAHERSEIVDQFQAGEFPILIAHPRTAGHGFTLTKASYAVYFSLSYSLEEYYQSMDRIHRIGQKQKCTYIHLLCENSIDEELLKVLQNKESVARNALAFLK